MRTSGNQIKHRMEARVFQRSFSRWHSMAWRCDTHWNQSDNDRYRRHIERVGSITSGARSPRCCFDSIALWPNLQDSRCFPVVRASHSFRYHSCRCIPMPPIDSPQRAFDKVCRSSRCSRAQLDADHTRDAHFRSPRPRRPSRLDGRSSEILNPAADHASVSRAELDHLLALVEVTAERAGLR